MDIAVIGTVFVDVKGFAAGRYDGRGRNVGRVDIVQGGVARNVACDLASLGAHVRFVSCVDGSGMGGAVLSRLHELGIDTRFVADGGMGIWMVINDERGEQAGSLSQLPDVTPVVDMLRERGSEIAAGADCVVLEPDISYELAQSAAQLCAVLGKRLFILPGNMSVILEYPELLTVAECFICNEIEAGRLFGCDTADASPGDMMELLCRRQDDMCIRSMVVTMGARGAVWRDAAGGCGHADAIATQVADVTGAGDAFFSGTVYALMRGRTLGAAVAYGTQLASWTIGETGNCFELTPERRQVLAEMERDE